MVSDAERQKIEAQVRERFRQAVLSEKTIAAMARQINPDPFEPTSGFGHQEFAEEDREARSTARFKARRYLEAALSKAQEIMEGENDAA